jgi:Uma2 family endonuclease
MPPSTAFSDQIKNLADLVQHLGGIPLERIRMQPPPGTATVADLIAACESPQKVLCELIDGVLVEKVMGAAESYLSGIILQNVNNFLQEQDLGLAFGPDGPFRILPAQVRLPDVSVFTWERIPSRKVPTKKVRSLVPDLAVEVISEGNTRGEIRLKLREYFLAGVRQVWVVYPRSRSAEIYSAPNRRRRVTRSQSLTSNAILPGFELPLSKLFERMELPRKKR